MLPPARIGLYLYSGVVNNRHVPAARVAAKAWQYENKHGYFGDLTPFAPVATKQTPILRQLDVQSFTYTF
ncbi:MAG: hypothetical protein NVS9B15_17990 [Acidobacteriaceae bacterium]